MSIQAFTVTSPSTIGSPSSAGENLIAVSSDAADTMNLTLTGATTAPAAVTETRALTGRREVSFSTNSLADLTGAKLASAAAGSVYIRGQGTKAVGAITVPVNPSNNETLTIGLTGFTQVYTFKATLTGAANEIHLGADRFITARNIARAINAGTGAGTDYGTGTAANTYVQGYADSGFTDDDPNGTSEDVVYIRDRIACQRSLTWSVSDTSTGITSVAPTGGANGTTLLTISAGTTQVLESMTFNTPDVTDGTLLALSTPTSDAINLGGRLAVLHCRAANLANAVVAHLEESDDGITWASRSATYAITNMDNNEQWLELQPMEFVRLVIDTNANTVDSEVHAVLIVG